jgi:hypothetical protein
LLLHLEPVADRDRHPHRLDQRRLAWVAVRQRFELAEAAREIVGRGTLVQQLDQFAGGCFVDVGSNGAVHGSSSSDGGHASASAAQAIRGPSAIGLNASVGCLERKCKALHASLR